MQKKKKQAHLKGIVHFKMKIWSSLTHPQVVSNLYDFFFLLETKEDILKNIGNQTVDGPH